MNRIDNIYKRCSNVFFFHLLCFFLHVFFFYNKHTKLRLSILNAFKIIIVNALDISLINTFKMTKLDTGVTLFNAIRTCKLHVYP